MRIIHNKVEYYIKCGCGLEFAYATTEANDQYLRCPRCNGQNKLTSTNKLLVSTIVDSTHKELLCKRLE